jgi:hypothetical protein
LGIQPSALQIALGLLFHALELDLRPLLLARELFSLPRAWRWRPGKHDRSRERSKEEQTAEQYQSCAEERAHARTFHISLLIYLRIPGRYFASVTL